MLHQRTGNHDSAGRDGPRKQTLLFASFWRRCSVRQEEGGADGEVLGEGLDVVDAQASLAIEDLGAERAVPEHSVFLFRGMPGVAHACV